MRVELEFISKSYYISFVKYKISINFAEPAVDSSLRAGGWQTSFLSCNRKVLGCLFILTT